MNTTTHKVVDTMHKAIAHFKYVRNVEENKILFVREYFEGKHRISFEYHCSECRCSVYSSYSYVPYTKYFKRIYELGRRLFIKNANTFCNHVK